MSYNYVHISEKYLISFFSEMAAGMDPAMMAQMGGMGGGIPQLPGNVGLAIDEYGRPFLVMRDQVRKFSLYGALPETPSRGGQISEMTQVCDYDILIVLGELNTLI